MATALRAAQSARGGKWIGWPGLSLEELSRQGGLPPSEDPNVTLVPVPLSAAEVTQFYGQFSNRTLWPLFHYFLEHVRQDGAAWVVYERVNQRFAEIAAEQADDDALIWVHDYQLLRVPAYIRARRSNANIAFFLHIPFPAADVLRVLPWDRALLRGVLGADYIGVHTATYAAHLLGAVERLLGCETDRANGLIRFEGREVAVGVHPIGVPAAQIEEFASGAPAQEDGMRQLIGVDRLDYTKGIVERLLALERLLERHPEHRGCIVFTQVAVPTRERVEEYGVLKRQVDEAVGRINGRFAEEGWSPIRYIARPLDERALAQLYARADVALVTPLRDGMNLVAKEYVAAQCGEPGVLVLSELAGAAEELQEAVLVNPFDIDGMAEALHLALTMPPEERRSRMAALRDRVQARDVMAWAEGFLDAAESASRRARQTRPTPGEALARRLVPWLGARPRAAVFLDYDGTITPIVERPEDAVLDARTLESLELAAGAAHLDVAIVSGRALNDLRRLVPVNGITLVGNHGLEIEGPGLHWEHPDSPGWRGALDEAERRLAALREEGSWVEHKGATLSWHLRQMSEEARDRAIRRGATVLAKLGLRAVTGKAVLEARPPVDWSKGRAVLHVLRARHGERWPLKLRAIYLGDDRTDEDAFQSLQGIGRSIRVGGPDADTAAEETLPDPEAVGVLVRWLASGAWLGAGT